MWGLIERDVRVIKEESVESVATVCTGTVAPVAACVHGHAGRIGWDIYSPGSVDLPGNDVKEQIHT